MFEALIIGGILWLLMRGGYDSLGAEQDVEGYISDAEAMERNSVRLRERGLESGVLYLASDQYGWAIEAARRAQEDGLRVVHVSMAAMLEVVGVFGDVDKAQMILLGKKPDSETVYYGFFHKGDSMVELNQWFQEMPEGIGK